MLEQNKSKVRLFRWSGIITLIAVIFLALIILFWNQSQIKVFIDQDEPSLASISYLRTMLKNSPHDDRLRIMLVDQLYKLDRLDEASDVLRPLLSGSNKNQWQSRLKYINIRRQLLYALDESDPQRISNLHELSALLDDLIQQKIPKQHLEQLAQFGLELNRPEIAALLYERLAEADPSRRPELLALSGKWHLAAGDSESSATAYHLASLSSPDDARARQYTILALDAVQAADHAAAAMSIASDCARRFPDDPAVLDRTISLAQTYHQPDLAQKWGKARLSLEPDNQALIYRQLELALAVGDLDAASTYARQLLEKKPDNAEYRLQLARILEWNSAPREALKHWLWLARNNSHATAANKALELARGLADDLVRIEMLTMSADQMSLSDNKIKELRDAYMRVGKQKSGATFFSQYVNRNEDNLIAWKALAQLQERGGFLHSAVKTWRLIGSRFSQTFQATYHQSRLLWRAGDREQAFRLSVAQRKHAKSHFDPYWLQLGNQAWELERPDIALPVYLKLWKEKKATPLESERLILLHKANKQYQEAIILAEQAFTKFSEARFLLLGADIVIETENWDELKRLLGMAERTPQQFENSVMYWLQKALLASKLQHLEQAKKAYQQALEIDNTSVSARIGLLWLLMEKDEKKQLAQLLNAWETDAVNDSAYWGVYALGYWTLGLTQQALPWFERKASNNPNDVSFLLNYAQALSQSGQVDNAWRLQQYLGEIFPGASALGTTAAVR